MRDLRPRDGASKTMSVLGLGASGLAGEGA